MNTNRRWGSPSFVTHDQDGPRALPTRIAVMNRGQVVQVGTPSEIYEFRRIIRSRFHRHHHLFEGT
jgi:ABC-type Fe3+/spermidine/putrescine transport system ATPase subunit